MGFLSEYGHSSRKTPDAVPGSIIVELRMSVVDRRYGPR